MPKLKSLRGAIGTYGRVAANGIVEVDDAHAEKLLKTKNFVRATAKDIEAAQRRREAEIDSPAIGATPGFSAMPEAPQSLDRLQEMIERGAITADEAEKLTSLQLSLSSEEVQTMMKKAADELRAEFDGKAEKLDQRTAELDARESELTAQEAALLEREKALADAKAGAAAASQAAEEKNRPATNADDAGEKKAKK